jgi:hypothetical protein
VLTSATDGRNLICNGKHIVAALKKLQPLANPGTVPPGGGMSPPVGDVPIGQPSTAAESASASQPEWLCGEVELIFSEGLRMDVVEFTESRGDRLHHIAWCCLAHEVAHSVSSGGSVLGRDTGCRLSSVSSLSLPCRLMRRGQTMCLVVVVHGL